VSTPQGKAAEPPGPFPVAVSDDLLLVFSKPKAGREAEFEKWYARHLEEFVRIPGVSAAQRFVWVKQVNISDGLLEDVAMYRIAASNAAGLDATVQARMQDGRMENGAEFYEPSMFHGLYRPLALATPARSIPGANPKPLGAGPVKGDFLMVFSDPKTPDQEEAYNAWYDHQHMPDVLRVPGFVAAQRFVRVGGDWKLPRYLVIFQFETGDPQVTNQEIGRRIREKITVMSPAFGSALGAMATPAGPAAFASAGAPK
jgi:hypothetical protein